MSENEQAAWDTVEKCRDLVRYLSAKRKTWREDSVSTLFVIRTICENTTKGNTKDLRFNNEKVKRVLVDDPGVLEFFLRVCPYTREHIRGDGINEFVFRIKPDSIAKCQEISIAIDTLLDEERDSDSSWWDNLRITIRVVAPDGTDMLGNFAPNESVWDINQWVARRVSLRNAVLGDTDLTLDDSTLPIEVLNLYRRCLRFKLEGDLGKAKMEQVEIERRREAEVQQAKRVADFASKQ